MKKSVWLLALAAVVPIPGCHDDSDDDVAAVTTYRQVERLARPAINEGLVRSNAFLNAFNEIPPSADLSPAAAPVVNEAAGTLTALGNTAAQVNAIAGAFLPDVMRIDTTGASGYANAFNAAGSPVRGRLLLDDVIDITLSVVVPGVVPALESDNVPYYRPAAGAGSTNPAIGHDFLNGQTVQNGPATFPFLAEPN